MFAYCLYFSLVVVALVIWTYIALFVEDARDE